MVIIQNLHMNNYEKWKMIIKTTRTLDRKFFGDADGRCGCQDMVEAGQVPLFGGLCQKCDPNIGDVHKVYVLVEL